MDQTSTQPSCCTEMAAARPMLSRRGLFGAAALAGTTTVIGDAVLQTAAASLAPSPSVLVVLSMRGAADGMSLAVPYGDPVYYQARPKIAIPKGKLLATDGFFGLHPRLKPLIPLWNGGKLAVVHAAGLPSVSRSHFAAMEEMEDADPGSSARIGWLNRLIGTDAISSPLQAVNVGGAAPPSSLYGPEHFMSLSKVDQVQIAGDGKGRVPRGRVTSLHTMWDGQKTPLGAAASSTFSAVKAFKPVTSTAAGPRNGASYPKGSLGKAMAVAARIVRGDAGVSVITIDQGAWDMHTGLGTLEYGAMIRNTEEFAKCVAAFFTDIGGLASKVTLVTMSEFGRRVKENANVGLDHGYGNVMFVAGAGVKGGKYYANWPTITNDVDADLLVTTDYRSVLSEVVAARFTTSTSQVFPGFTRERVGLMVGQ